MYKKMAEKVLKISEFAVHMICSFFAAEKTIQVQ